MLKIIVLDVKGGNTLESFQFFRTPTLTFGPGTAIQVSPLAAKEGKRSLLVRGEKSLEDSPYYQKIVTSLREHRVEARHVIIKNEPSPTMVDQVVEEYHREDISSVIAIGGGSVLDAGKAISAMLPLEGESVKMYIEGVGFKIHSGSKIPFFALPTTAGTGSEATRNAVLSEVKEGGYKRSIRHENFIPDAAIIDPELALGSPPAVTFSCGMDALTQLFESYLSRNASPLSDTLNLKGLTFLKDSFLPLFHHPDHLSYRGKMALAAFISGITLTNTGLGVVHGLASVIGGLINIPHGIICGALLKGVIEATIEEMIEKGDDESLRKCGQLGALFKGRAVGEPQEDAFSLLDEIHYYQEFFALPLLGSWNFTEKHLHMVLKEDVNQENSLPLPLKKIERILQEQILP